MLEIKEAKVKFPISLLEEQALRQPPPLGFEKILRKKQRSSYAIIAEIKKTAASQRQYTSAHKYDLEKFGLSAGQIRSDCSFIYDFHKFV